MSVVLLSTPAASSSTADPKIPLDRFWQDIASSTLYKKWRTQNPGEYQRLLGYAAGSPQPVMTTAFGRCLVDVVEAQRLLGDPSILIP